MPAVFSSYAEKKAEVDEIICWLTEHTEASLAAVIAERTSFADFIAHAPALNPARGEVAQRI